MKKCTKCKTNEREYESYCQPCYRELKNRSKLKSLYGITPEEKLEMYVSQSGKCKICHSPIKKEGKHTHIDHNHKTGRVRGLLCSNCNTGLGKFKDKVSNLQSAIEYLREDLEHQLISMDCFYDE